MLHDTPNNDPEFPKLERPTLLTRIRRYFISGVLLAAPLTLTIYFVWAIVTTLDDWVKNILPGKSQLDEYLGHDIPGLGLVLAFIMFTIIGAFAAGFLGRFFEMSGAYLMQRMPVVRGLYSTVKQIVEAVIHRDKKSFSEVVLIEYPSKGLWALGFVSGATTGEIQDMSREEILNVFVPTAPNPTSGYLLFIPRKNCKTLKMSVEDGLKLVVSAGVVSPNTTPSHQVH